MYADEMSCSKEMMEQNWKHPPRRPAKYFKTLYNSRSSCEDGDDERRQDSTHTIQKCIDKIEQFGLSLFQGKLFCSDAEHDHYLMKITYDNTELEEMAESDCGSVTKYGTTPDTEE